MGPLREDVVKCMVKIELLIFRLSQTKTDNFIYYTVWHNIFILLIDILRNAKKQLELVLLTYKYAINLRSEIKINNSRIQAVNINLH